MTFSGVGGNGTNDLSEPLWTLSSFKPFESKVSEGSGDNGVIDLLQFSELCWTTPSFESFTGGVGDSGINDVSSFSELFWMPSSFKPFETTASEGKGGNGVVDLLRLSELFCWILLSSESTTSNGLGGTGITDVSNFAMPCWALNFVSS